MCVTFQLDLAQICTSNGQLLAFDNESSRGLFCGGGGDERPAATAFPLSLCAGIYSENFIWRKVSVCVSISGLLLIHSRRLFVLLFKLPPCRNYGKTASNFHPRFCSLLKDAWNISSRNSMSRRSCNHNKHPGMNGNVLRFCMSVHMELLHPLA